MRPSILQSNTLHPLIIVRINIDVNDRYNSLNLSENPYIKHVRCTVQTVIVLGNRKVLPATLCAVHDELFKIAPVSSGQALQVRAKLNH